MLSIEILAFLGNYKVQSVAPFDVPPYKQSGTYFT